MHNFHEFFAVFLSLPARCIAQCLVVMSVSGSVRLFFYLLPVGMLLRVSRLQVTLGRVFVALALLVLTCVGLAVLLIRDTLRFCDSTPEYHDMRTGKLEREVVLPTDAMYHVLLFRWRFFGRRHDGWLYQQTLRKLNMAYDDWDIPFEVQGQDPKTQVLDYCMRYGVQTEPWVWSKPAEEYETMNEFFARRHRPELTPERLCADAPVVAPATGVVSFFETVAQMPALLKNERFDFARCGIPRHAAYEPNAACLFYLSAADYHNFHAPFGGRVRHVAMLAGATHSAGCQPELLEHTNLLATNRRAVVVIACDGGGGGGGGGSRGSGGGGPLLCALVAIGGIAADSIRLDDTLTEGATVSRGQRLGCFARGGSAVALFFTSPVRLVAPCAAVHARGLRFKVDCGSALAEFDL